MKRIWGREEDNNILMAKRERIMAKRKTMTKKTEMTTVKKKMTMMTKVMVKLVCWYFRVLIGKLRK